MRMLNVYVVNELTGFSNLSHSCSAPYGSKVLVQGVADLAKCRPGCANWLSRIQLLRAYLKSWGLTIVAEAIDRSAKLVRMRTCSSIKYWTRLRRRIRRRDARRRTGTGKPSHSRHSLNTSRALITCTRAKRLSGLALCLRRCVPFMESTTQNYSK